MNLTGQKILIFGGSGSLGNQLIQTYLIHNEIINYSRDENKHWSMELQYKKSHPNCKLTNVIGDIRDSDKVKQTLIRHQPTIIIIAAALKHIDRCEFEINESLGTNILGIQNVLNCIETHITALSNLKTVCFISTDKACSPVNIYGMCKSVCEGLMVEKAKYIPDIKFVSVRYGNVLNSRGSIIPILQQMCEGTKSPKLKLTSTEMTRYIMTLEDAVELIQYAIISGKTGEIVIPKLSAMRIADLFELFAERYNGSIEIMGLRSGEKIHESLINETQSLRTLTSMSNEKYYHINPSYITKPVREDMFHYHSGLDTLCREELLGYLCYKGLFSSGPQPLANIQVSNANSPFSFGQIDRVLDPAQAYRAQTEILALPDAAWDRYNNPFEQKWTLRDKNQLPPTVQSVFDFLTSDAVITTLSDISGKRLYNDPTKQYWGVHKYDTGDHLGIHVDAGLHPVTKTKKQVTFGIYLSKNWKNDTGCDLEMWSGDSAHLDEAKLGERVAKIAPLFNRAVWFDNTDNSWHGNPTKSTSLTATRIFVTISYLSDNQDQYLNKRTRAFFRPLPTDSNPEKLHAISLDRASETKYADVYRALAKM